MIEANGRKRPREEHLRHDVVVLREAHARHRQRLREELPHDHRRQHEDRVGQPGHGVRHETSEEQRKHEREPERLEHGPAGTDERLLVAQREVTTDHRGESSATARSLRCSRPRARDDRGEARGPRIKRHVRQRAYWHARLQRGSQGCVGGGRRWPARRARRARPLPMSLRRDGGTRCRGCPRRSSRRGPSPLTRGPGTQGFVATATRESARTARA